MKFHKEKRGNFDRVSHRTCVPFVFSSLFTACQDTGGKITEYISMLRPKIIPNFNTV